MTMPVLESERLILRKWKLSDGEPFAALNADPMVMRFFPATLTRVESDAMADRIRKHFEDKGFGLWAVELRETKSFIGFAGLAVPTFEAQFMPCVEIGWRLAKEHWGKGYATEAARSVLHYGFSRLKLKEIVSFTSITNHPSIRVMERIGLSHNPEDDFDHPKVPVGHVLRRHVFYRKSQIEWEG